MTLTEPLKLHLLRTSRTVKRQMKRPHCELILYQCICDLHVTRLPELYYLIIFLDNRVRRKFYASCDCLVGSGGM